MHTNQYIIVNAKIKYFINDYWYEQNNGIDKWHHIALKSVPIDNGFNRPINGLKKHERLCNNHDYCRIEMPNNDNNTLKYNHGEKSLKAPWVIYADFE